MKNSPPTPEAAHARLAEACRSAGIPVTPQRAVIYRALVESFDHPSPEALFERVQRELPSVSLATIYKTLDLLVELRLACELPSTGDTKRFDGRVDQHHHLVCKSCGSVEDFVDASLDRVAIPRGIKGFKAEMISIHIHGTCRSCAGGARA